MKTEAELRNDRAFIAELAARETQLGVCGDSFVPTHRHVNSAKLYEKIAVAMHTETKELLVIYCNPEGTVWARPRDMFEDGRFEELKP